MPYLIYRLEFTTGLHIGADGRGQSLGDGQMALHSDTLFSALCCQCARTGQAERMAALFREGALTLSDGLPYAGEEYYLPKPIAFVRSDGAEKDPVRKKAFKALGYIPLSGWGAYLQGMKGAAVDPDELRREFGILSTEERVSLRGEKPEPYYVGCWRFLPQCGLYVAVRYADEAALAFLEETLTSLGLSGVGGKQSSGLGKFGVEKRPVPEALEALLTDDAAPYHMLLGTALPADAQLDEALAGGWYAVLRRGGFVRSDTYAPRPLKKRTLVMLAPGSCLRRRFDGGMFDVSDGGSHPVWRCGKTLFAGVRV